MPVWFKSRQFVRAKAARTLNTEDLVRRHGETCKPEPIGFACSLDKAKAGDPARSPASPPDAWHASRQLARGGLALARAAIAAPSLKATQIDLSGSDAGHNRPNRDSQVSPLKTAVIPISSAKLSTGAAPLLGDNG